MQNFDRNQDVGQSRTIDLENHFATEAWLHALRKNDSCPQLVEDKAGKYVLHLSPGCSMSYRHIDKLMDVGEGRIKAIEEAGIDLAVLSLAAPGTEAFDPKVGAEVSRSSNDALAGAIDRNPDRLQGWATLAPRDPEGAAKELERAVKDLGLKGWNAHSNFGDSYLDEKRYRPILAKAAELGVPVYLHPTAPIIPQFTTYGQALAGASFGFGAETAMVMMRLIFSGVFDAFPQLKIILGHYAEGLPFMLDRVDRSFIGGYVAADPIVGPKLKARPSYYLLHNMIASTSGNYSAPAFRCTKDALGTRRMVLGTDYPFEDMGACMAFLEQQPMSEVEKADLHSGTSVGLIQSFMEQTAIPRRR